MNISNEHLLLINILNTMYNDNNRQIQNLTNQNNQIISIITEILHVPSSSTNRQQSNRQTNNNRQQSNNRQTNNNNRQSNNQNNLGSLFLNNRQYIIDDIQRLELPINTSVSGIEGRLTGNYRDRTQNERPQTERPSTIFSNLFQSFFDPVLIYPTASQIETATRRVLYRDIVTPINTRCPISLETFNDSDIVTIIRQCGHIFNSDELNNWFTTNCRCPMCRYDIRNYNSTNLSLRTNQERTLMQDFSGNYIQDLSGNYTLDSNLFYS
jgi:hypothetical protein